jgi:hypothetical protein
VNGLTNAPKTQMTCVMARVPDADAWQTRRRTFSGDDSEHVDDHLNAGESILANRILERDPMDTIKVTVVEFGDRKHYQMQYRDPNTRRKVTRSTEVERTGNKKERTAAERAAAKWEDELREGRYQPPSRISWDGGHHGSLPNIGSLCRPPCRLRRRSSDMALACGLQPGSMPI